MSFALAEFDPWFIRLNVIEACVWLLIALAIFLHSKRQSIDLVLVAAIIAFGVSDLVETQTGGWFKPWWLFLWKAICVCSIASTLIFRLRQSRSR